MEIFLESSLDWVSCIHVLMQIAGVSDQCRRIQEFYKAEVKAFKSRNSYKTWHEITRLSAPTQISHILLSLARLEPAAGCLVDTGYLFRWFPTAVSWSRTLPGPSRCPGSFSPRPCNKTSFQPPAVVTRDAWQLTRDTWHNPPFCRQSQGESRPEWQQSSKMWQTTGGRQGERRYYHNHNIRSWGAVVKVWGISNRMSKYFINKNNFSDMVLSSKTRTQNIN